MNAFNYSNYLSTNSLEEILDLSQIGLLHNFYREQFIWQAIPYDFPMVLFSPHIPNALLEEYANGGFQGWLGEPSQVAQSPHTPAHLLEKLVERDDTEVRAAAAKNSQLSVNLLAKLAQDSSVEVRGCVARNRSTSLEILTRLAQDSSVEVRVGVAKNRSTPVELLAQLAQDENWEVLYWIGKHPNLSMELLEQLIAAESSKIPYGIPFHPKASVEEAVNAYQWKVMEYDDCYDYRKAVASYPYTPEILLELLEKPYNCKAWGGLIENWRTPIKILERILSNKLLYSLSLTPGDRVPLNAAIAYLEKNPEGLPFVAENFAKYSKSLFERFLALSYPQIPSSAISPFVGESEWILRYAIACNPSTPTDILKILSQDANRVVRDTASGRL